MSTPKSHRDLAKRSFLAIHEGWATERVIADPTLNAKYISGCGVELPGLPAEYWNRLLMNLRKGGKLRGLHARATNFPDLGAYRFAAEISMRLLERRDSVTLDDVLCDPSRVAEFDQLCADLAPGFEPLKYRWAALSTRKRSKLKPEPLAHVVPSESVRRVAAENIDIASIPDCQGIYLLYSQSELLCVGEAESLRARLHQHFDHSDNKLVARWLWENGHAAMHADYYQLPVNTMSRTRKALELDLIRSRKPLFNIQR